MARFIAHSEDSMSLALALAAALFAAPAGAKPAATATAAPAKPAAATAPAKQPGAPSASKPAPLEAVVSEQAIEAMLVAAAPFDEEMEQEIGALGFTKTVKVKIHLSDPHAKVAADGVHVTMNYHLTDASGMVDQTGVATPLLNIVPIPAKKTLEARFSKSGITFAGVELPLEDLVDPMEIPAVIPQEVDLGDKKVTAEFHATEVVPEDGRVRIKGTVTFR